MSIALIHPLVAVALFVGALIVIYLRGYLIPGTPTLTKRYLPDTVLRWFDKHPPSTASEIDEDEARMILDLRAKGEGRDVPEEYRDD